MQPVDRIHTEIRVLAGELDRIEHEQARGAEILDDLAAAVRAWRCLWAQAAAADYLMPTHSDRLERFRWRAETAQPWEA